MINEQINRRKHVLSILSISTHWVYSFHHHAHSHLTVILNVFFWPLLKVTVSVLRTPWHFAYPYIGILLRQLKLVDLHSASYNLYFGQYNHLLTQPCAVVDDGPEESFAEQTADRPSSTCLLLRLCNVSFSTSLGSSSLSAKICSVSPKSCCWYGFPMVWFGRNVVTQRTNNSCNSWLCEKQQINILKFSSTKISLN